MRTEEARPVRLEDYRPPDWLVETVELDVSLDPAATRVRATLDPAAQRERSRAGAARARRRRARRCVRCKLDGAALPPEQFVATADRLTIAQPPQRPFRLEIETVVDPSANTQLMGLYRSGGDLLHPMRGGRLPPHHLFPRPARRDGGLHHAHRGRQGRGAGAARQRQSRSTPATCRARAAISRSGTTRSRSRPICSRWSAASSACVEDRFRTMSGREVDAAHLCRARQGSALRLRDGLAQALDALGREGVRPRIRSRHLHDRRRVRLQHGRDGEQGPQRLQRQIRARLARDRDRRRLRRGSRRSSRTNISTTGPATASPAATGSSSASRKA